MIKIAGAAVVALTLTQATYATPITGDIGFTGNAALDTSSAGTATEVTAWSDTAVSADSGSFAAYITVPPNVAATFNNSVAWKFNDPSTPINNFWQVGGFTFELLSSYIVAQPAGYVDVAGTGTVSGNGYTPTTMSWSFSVQDPSIAGANGPVWTFSASTSSIPDGGSTVMLLGLALSGAALLRRKLMA